MVNLSLAGEQEDRHERARASVDEEATRLRTMEAEHALGYRSRNSKLEKNH